MSKSAFLPSILTANRLGDGIVVFLDFEGAWSDDFGAAVVAGSPDEARALEDRGVHDAAQNLVVEPYLIEVREAGGRYIPIRYRERVRVAGPSIIADVPGYVMPPAVVRQAHHGVGDRGHHGVGDRGEDHAGFREPHTRPRAEPVEARPQDAELVEAA